jgi:hypothetical protein
MDPLLFCPGNLVLIKSLNPTQDINTPLWEGPYLVILSTPMTARVAGLIPGSITQESRAGIPL